MKHDLKVTFFLVALFIAAQVAGLLMMLASVDSVSEDEEGNILVVYDEPLTGRPDLEKEDSFTYTLSMILLGTALLLLLIRFKLFKVWKAWFFLAVWGALSISLSVFLPEIPAILLGIILAAWKLFRPNVIVHNLTEVLMYGGIALLLSPLFTVFWAVMLLLAISVYDAIAVWKLKHMITLATAQAQEKMFAGLLIPYSAKHNNMAQKKERDEKQKQPIKEIKSIESPTETVSIPKSSKISINIPKGFKEEGVKSAILGGGDIAFPLLFAGSVMTSLIESGIAKEIAFFQSLFVSFFAGAALLILFLKSEKDKFYPAMPFITAGCLIGYGAILLIGLI